MRSILLTSERPFTTIAVNGRLLNGGDKDV